MPGKHRKRLLPYDESLTDKARELRNQPTPAEKHFWYHLRQMPFYKETRFNRQKPIGSYIVDFYCHRHQLVIEIDGDTHGTPQAKKKDQARTEFLSAQGLTVVRFTNREVMHNIEGVLGEVERVIGKKEEKSP
ncbi:MULTISPECIES: endonuclease domain-containing protein [unclassified Nitrospina]|uniref:endonuclease domain-containing protein n=1 Tax=unclassified Nitrospina TaxID=2638683 RepID=UPI003F95F7E6